MPYQPSEPFTTPMKILIPTYKTVNGVKKKTYPEPSEVSDDLIFFCSFRTFGGTETTVNGVYSLENTAAVETWYRPDITAGCRVVLLQNSAIYDVIGEPENISLRNQYLKFKIRAIKGGA